MRLLVLLTGDRATARENLRGLLEREHFEVIEASADGLDAARLAEALGPDLVILSQCLSGVAGTATVAAIHKALPQTPVILLTPSATETEINAVLAAGIRGCVFDTDPVEDVIRAVYDVARGGSFLSPGASLALFEPYLPATPLSDHPKAS